VHTHGLGHIRFSLRMLLRRSESHRAGIVNSAAAPATETN
jgi:hypothetical protein